MDGDYPEEDEEEGGKSQFTCVLLYYRCINTDTMQFDVAYAV